MDNIFLNYNKEVNEILSLLQSTGAKDVSVQYGIRSISFNDFDGELSLYITYLPLKRISIPTVQLPLTRSGVFSAIFAILASIAFKEHIGQICIQSVLTEAMRNFCIKHGLKEIPQGNSSYDVSDFVFYLNFHSKQFAR